MMSLLIATGGAPHSDLAVRLGGQVACRTGAIPTVLVVIKHEKDRTRADRTLLHARQLLAPEVSEVRTKIRVGHPAEEIIREAEESSYGLVVMGEKPRHDLVTRFLGSTVERVVENAPCPVLIAKGKIGPLRRFLLCDSGATEPTLLSRLKVRLAKLVEDQVEITVLHVMSQIGAGPGVWGEQLQANAEELIQKHTPEGELLEQDIRVLKQLHIHSQPKVRHGLVVDEILAEARSGDYDLVIIGAHRGAGWQRFLLDDLAHQIIVQVDRPVLVVR
jgi:nucleotide-binding universal stress UspA family protein